MLNYYSSLFKEKKFFLIWLGQVFSKIGDSLHEIVLVWISIKISSDDYYSIGLVFFIRFLPYLFFGFIGGIYSDQLNKRKLMVTIDILRGLSILPLILLILTNHLKLWHLSLVLLILTVLRSFFQPALQSFLPDLLKKEQLVHANSLLQASYEVAGIIGPVIGGLLLSSTSAEIVFLIDSTTFFISALSIFLISYKPLNGLEGKDLNPLVLSGFKDTLNLLKETKNVLFSIIFSALAILTVSGVLRLAIPIYVSKILGNDSQFLGIIMSAMAIGTVLGALIAGTCKSKSYERMMFIGWIFYGFILGLFGLFHKSLATIFFAHLLGFFGAVVDVLLISIIQISIPIKFMGKTFSLFSTLANIGESISSLLVGCLLVQLQIPHVFVLSSMCTIIVSILGLHLTNQVKNAREIRLH